MQQPIIASKDAAIDVSGTRRIEKLVSDALVKLQSEKPQKAFQTFKPLTAEEEMLKYRQNIFRLNQKLKACSNSAKSKL